MSRHPTRSRRSTRGTASSPQRGRSERRSSKAAGHYVWGVRPIEELLRAAPKSVRRLEILQSDRSRPQLTQILSLAREASVPTGLVDASTFQRRLAEAAGHSGREPVHQGVIATMAPFAYASLEALIGAPAAAPPVEALASASAPLVIALDQVQDPHNVGAIARSALAFGATGIVLPKDRACEVTSGVLKASAGALAHLPVAQVVNLARALRELKDAGFWVVGTVAEASADLQTVDFTGPIVLVIGAEGQGLRRTIRETCDFLVTIPMVAAMGSLNASVAAGICLYAAANQRRAVEA